MFESIIRVLLLCYQCFRKFFHKQCSTKYWYRMSNSELQGTSKRQVLETSLPLIFQLNPGKMCRFSLEISQLLTFYFSTIKTVANFRLKARTQYIEFSDSNQACSIGHTLCVSHQIEHLLHFSNTHINLLHILQQF